MKDLFIFFYWTILSVADIWLRIKTTCENVTQLVTPLVKEREVS